jgi:hypothetical protein
MVTTIYWPGVSSVRHLNSFLFFYSFYFFLSIWENSKKKEEVLLRMGERDANAIRFVVAPARILKKIFFSDPIGMYRMYVYCIYTCLMVFGRRGVTLLTLWVSEPQVSPR